MICLNSLFGCITNTEKLGRLHDVNNYFETKVVFSFPVELSAVTDDNQMLKQKIQTLESELKR